jgi:hypothetical protein
MHYLQSVILFFFGVVGGVPKFE